MRKQTKYSIGTRLLGGVAALIATSPAWASGPEDFATEPAPAVPLAVSGFDWSGSYVGLNLGAVRSDGRAELGDYSGDLIVLDVANGLFPPSIGSSESTTTGGVAFGYNIQRDAFVGGIEFDLSKLGHEVRLDYSRIDPNPAPPFTGIDTNTTYVTEIDAFATLRLRAGYAYGRTLVFASAGLAAGHVVNDFRIDLPDLGYSSPSWDEEGTRWGGALSVGVEQMVTDHVSLKLEVMRYDLRDVTIEATDPQNFPGQAIDYRFENAGTIARLGVVFRF